jgi:hypothetical protein
MNPSLSPPPISDLRGNRHTACAVQNAPSQSLRVGVCLIARKRLPQQRHRKARSEKVRRMESRMLLLWGGRILCQPHCGHERRSGLVTSSVSSSSISYSCLFKSSYSASLSRFLANFHAQNLRGYYPNPSKTSYEAGVKRRIVAFALQVYDRALLLTRLELHRDDT